MSVAAGAPSCAGCVRAPGAAHHWLESALSGCCTRTEVHSSGRGRRDRMAEHTASSGRRTPTVRRSLHTAAPRLSRMHAFGSALPAGRMRVYCAPGAFERTRQRGELEVCPAGKHTLQLRAHTAPGRHCLAMRNKFGCPGPAPVEPRRDARASDGGNVAARGNLTMRCLTHPRASPSCTLTRHPGPSTAG